MLSSFCPRLAWHSLMDALVACLRAVAPLGAALGLGFLLRRTHLFAAADGEVSAGRNLDCEFMVAGRKGARERPCMPPSPADRRQVRYLDHPAVAHPSELQWVRSSAAPGHGTSAAAAACSPPAQEVLTRRLDLLPPSPLQGDPR